MEKLEEEKKNDLLYEAIDEYVYKLLEEENLQRLPVPKLSNWPIKFRTFIYASVDSFKNDKLLILVNGCGAKAGQWSRRTILNDKLDYGTQLSYIRKAKDLGYGILVLNINDNLRFVGENLHIIIDSYEHFTTVWNDYVLYSKAKNIAIIAHEFGGDCVMQYGITHEEQFRDRVFAIALIDSMRIINWKDSQLKNICQSWPYVCINLEEAKKPKGFRGKVPLMCIANDDNNREKLPITCMTSIFDYIESRYFYQQNSLTF